jgi:hypothetical protein
MKRLNLKYSLFSLLAFLLSSGCARSLKDFEKAQEDALADLIATTSGSAVTDSTSKRAALEIALLDSLQQKYPGRTKTVTVTKYEKIITPGQTLTVYVPMKVDSTANKSEADSLLARLITVSSKYQADLALQGEITRVKAQLLAALNRRGALPDTTVFFANAPGYWLRVHRLPAGRYNFTLNTPEKTDSVATQTNVTSHTPPVYVRDPWYIYWQFWAAFGVAVTALLALFLVVKSKATA